VEFETETERVRDGMRSCGRDFVLLVRELDLVGGERVAIDARFSVVT
jgi:hypothetical protein